MNFTPAAKAMSWVRSDQYLGCNVSNLVQPVHHIVEQLQLLIAQAAEIQWPRSFTRLDDAGNVLQTQLDSVDSYTSTRAQPPSPFT